LPSARIGVAGSTGERCASSSYARPLGYTEYLAWLRQVLPEAESQEEPVAEAASAEGKQLSGLELLRKISEAARPKNAMRYAARGVPAPSKEDLALAEQSLWGEGKPGEVLASRFSVDLKRSQLQCLRPGEWLNDEVINFYFKLLQERTRRPEAPRRCWFTNSFFWPKLSGKGHAEYNFKEVRRWTTKAKVDIFDQDYVIFPMNIGETHWALGAIDFRERGFRYFDSMFSRPHSNFVPFLRKYLSDEHKAKKGGKALEGIDGWELIKPENPLPKQRNGYDCGVFTCSFAEWFSQGLALDFSQDDMPNLRLRLAARVVRADENWD